MPFGEEVQNFDHEYLWETQWGYDERAFQNGDQKNVVVTYDQEGALVSITDIRDGTQYISNNIDSEGIRECQEEHEDRLGIVDSISMLDDRKLENIERILEPEITVNAALASIQTKEDINYQERAKNYI